MQRTNFNAVTQPPRALARDLRTLQLPLATPSLSVSFVQPLTCHTAPSLSAAAGRLHTSWLRRVAAGT